MSILYWWFGSLGHTCYILILPISVYRYTSCEHTRYTTASYCKTLTSPDMQRSQPNNITNVQMPTYTRTGFFPLQGIKKYSQPLLLRDENHKTFIPNIAGLCIPKATHKNDVFYNKCDRFKNKTNNPPKNNLPSLSWSLFHLFYNFKMCVSDWNTLSQWIAILRPFNKW